MSRRNLNIPSRLYFPFAELLLLKFARNHPETYQKAKFKRDISCFAVESRRLPYGQGGFTLTEMLIVLAIIAILTTAGLMSYIIARDKAKVASCYVSLEAVKKGLEGYTIEHNGYPEAAGINSFGDLSEKLKEYVDFSPRTTCDDKITYQSETGSYLIATAVHYTGGSGSFGVKLVLENGEIREEPL